MKKFYNIANLLFFIILILPLPLWAFLFALGISFLPAHADNWLPYVLIGVPTIAIVLTIFTLVKIVKAMGKKTFFLNKTSWLQKILHIVTMLFWTMSIVVMGIIILTLLNDSPPQFFPLDDASATYTITRQVKTYYINYHSTSNKNSYENCTYAHNGKYSCKTVVDRDVTNVVIGNSPVNLAPYVNKSILTSGNFTYGKKQCIQNNCIDIGNRAVFNISTIHLKK